MEWVVFYFILGTTYSSNQENDMKLMSEETKRKIRELMREKISIEDQLQITGDT